MASTVLSQSLFSAQSSSPSPTSKETISFSVSLKPFLGASRSGVVSTHLNKTHKSFVANSVDGSASAETPIELKYPAFPTVMDINQIREILPHRYPFLLVDRVIEYNPGVSAVGIKNVTINDHFFPGHFPERPIMPGVLMVEAMAQVGGLVMLQPEVGGSRDKFFFAGVDKVRFRKPVIAGDTLVMRMNLVKLQKRFGIAKMEGKAYVDGDVVCEGEFLMAIGSDLIKRLLILLFHLRNPHSKKSPNNFPVLRTLRFRAYRDSAVATFGAAATNANPNRSTEVVQPPGDSISSLCFSPKANLLVGTSWDNQVRCWEVQKSGTTINTAPKTAMSHDQPVLCSAWKDDGTTVFSGGCDKQVKMWQLASGAQPVTVAMHDAPVKELAWIPEVNMLATGSWDKTLKYWDLRQSTPALSVQLPDRCYALTVKHPLMVVGTADRNVIIYNLQNPQAEFKRIVSPLKYQTRCLSAFPDQQGFLVGSIEGRVGVHHLDDAQSNKNFTFKCHRDGNDIYSVNSLNFHPVHHTFATAGSDGAFNFWDKDSKQRLKAMMRCSQPIPCSAFNNDGSIYAYAVCYDWSKGAENHNIAAPKNHIYLHLPQDAEVKAKPRAATGGRK